MGHDGAVVDLDGTVYRGESLVPGARHGVERLRDAGIEPLFLSNKAIHRSSHYAALLSRLGVGAEPSGVLNSADVTASYLVETHPDRPVLVVGEPPLVEELEGAGIPVVADPEAAEGIVASMDRSFDYATLADALAVLDGADDALFVATNADRTCPVGDGEVPDAAGMIGAIEGVTGRELDAVLGKPSRVTVDAAMARLGEPPDRCLMIGDRLETDIAMGASAGMTTVLVLTGVTDEADLASAPVSPDHVIGSLGDIGEVIG